MNNSVKFILLILLVIVQLALFINLFPDLFKKVVIGSLILITNIIIGREENDTRNDVYWCTLFIIFLISCITIISVITITITILCVILKNQKCASFVLYACVTICLVFELVVFIDVYNNLNYGSKNIIAEWLDASVRDYKKPDCGYIRIILNYLLPMFKCCGYRSPDDWNHQRKFNETEYAYNHVPESCCIKPYPCDANSYYNQTSHWDGCNQNILRITVVAEIIGWAFGGLAIAKVTAVLLAKCYTAYIEKTSLILPTIRIYNVDDKKMSLKKHQNINDTLRVDVIRGSV